MGLFDLFSGDVSAGDILSTGLDVLGLGAQNSGGPSYSGITGVPMTYQTSFMPTYSFPQQSEAPPPMVPTAAAMPAVMGVARWASRFPALWQAIQRLAANTRARVTPDKLYSMLKQFGVQTLTSIIGAAAVSELILYKATRRSRRMNPANTRALRRSLRRLKSFDRLSHRVSAQLHRGGRKRSYSRGRCMTCRKSPCAC